MTGYQGLGCYCSQAPCTHAPLTLLTVPLFSIIPSSTPSPLTPPMGESCFIVVVTSWLLVFVVVVAVVVGVVVGVVVVAIVVGFCCFHCCCRFALCSDFIVCDGCFALFSSGFVVCG